MDGVTDACFRDLLMETHQPEDLGGAFTEFIRIHQVVPSEELFLRHLGPKRFPSPVGIQFMGNDPSLLKDCAAQAAAMGAPVVDINFGCPARGARKGCVGAALLDYPERITPIIDACVDGVKGKIPVTAKIRSGVEDDRQLANIVRAVENSGASLLTIHCRTKKEGYDADAIDWRRIALARKLLNKPLCGNGGVESLGEAHDMCNKVGCDFVMIGRAALANPWVFSGYEASTQEAAAFVLGYGKMMLKRGTHPKNALSRLKQMIRFWQVGDLVLNEDDRKTWLKTKRLEDFHHRLQQVSQT